MLSCERTKKKIRLPSKLLKLLRAIRSEWKSLKTIKCWVNWMAYTLRIKWIKLRVHFIFDNVWSWLGNRRDLAQRHFRTVVIVKIKLNPQQFENYARVRVSLELNSVARVFVYLLNEEKKTESICILSVLVSGISIDMQNKKNQQTTTSNHMNCANFASFLRGTIFLSATFMSRYFKCADRAPCVQCVVYTIGFR